MRPYQDEAVAKLVKSFQKLTRANHAQTQLVFKSPTGSGKTVMAAEFLNRLQNEDLNGKYIYIWAAPQKLHNQSREKVSKYLADSRYTLVGLENIGTQLQANTILFVNWESVYSTYKAGSKLVKEGVVQAGDWSNRAVRIGEDERNLVDVLQKCRDSGLEAVLIVDEAHAKYLGDNSQRIVNEVIQPKLIFEISATPNLNPSGEDIADNKARIVKVNFEEVVKSELIKQDTRINEGLGDFLNLETSQLEEVIAASLDRRERLAQKYQAAGSNVNPLILVQISNDDSNDANFDISVKQRVEDLLHEKGITYENGKLAVWLSDDKQNLEGIERNDNGVQVLIFKQAIALGWDCPRAQILTMLREIGSTTFKIQTVGRVLRMPELKHYADSELNSAYVYTNLDSIVVDNDDSDAKAFIKSNGSKLREGINNANLPSIYLHRTDFHDLTASFKEILLRHLDSAFVLSDIVTADQRYDKIAEQLELNPEHLQSQILTDVTVDNLDDIDQEQINKVAKRMESKYDITTIERLFKYQVKAWVLPYNVARSFDRMQRNLYKWFESCNIGMGNRDTIHRIIICNRDNLEKINGAINSAKQEFEDVRWNDIAMKRELEEIDWSLPARDEFGENYEFVDAKDMQKYAYDKAYFRKDRSQAERRFEEMCSENEAIDWWYKNGESMKQYFAVEYVDFDEQGRKGRRAFYPDFVIRYTDGTVGLYDTKSGLTSSRSSVETQRKSNALQMYIALWNSRNASGGQGGCAEITRLTGGILNETRDGFALVQGVHSVDSDTPSPWFSERLAELGFEVGVTPVDTIWAHFGERVANLRISDIAAGGVWG
jgi:type III restriction enzyme